MAAPPISVLFTIKVVCEELEGNCYLCAIVIKRIFLDLEINQYIFLTNTFKYSLLPHKFIS